MFYFSVCLQQISIFIGCRQHTQTYVFIYGQLAWAQQYSRPLYNNLPYKTIAGLNCNSSGYKFHWKHVNFTPKLASYPTNHIKMMRKNISGEKICFSNRLIDNNHDLTLFNSCQRVSHSFRSCNSAEMCPSDKWAVSCLSPVTSWSSSEVLTLNSKERRTTSTF